MTQYILRKLLIAIPALLVISIMVFSVMRLTRSDPVTLIVGTTATAEARQRVTKELHLDEGVAVQYLYFLTAALRGDFGRSFFLATKVSDLMAERLANTFKLGTTALVISYLFAVPIGVLAATHHRSTVDRLSVALAYAGQCIPSFVISLALILVFAYGLGWFPTSGSESLKSLVLPATALAFGSLSLAVRIVRTSMLEVLHQDYIRTARAKGLHEVPVVWLHALRNALIPVISVLGLQLGLLLGGTVVVEVVFAWPGVGRLLVDAVSRRDYPVVQGVSLVLATSAILANLLADILYALVNPRIRY